MKSFSRRHIHALDDSLSVDLSEEEQSIVNQTFDAYGTWTAGQLVAITHEKDTPWYKVTNKGKQFGRGLVIPNKIIREYYKSLANGE